MNGEHSLIENQFEKWINPLAPNVSRRLVLSMPLITAKKFDATKYWSSRAVKCIQSNLELRCMQNATLESLSKRNRNFQINFLSWKCLTDSTWILNLFLRPVEVLSSIYLPRWAHKIASTFTLSFCLSIRIQIDWKTRHSICTVTLKLVDSNVPKLKWPRRSHSDHRSPMELPARRLRVEVSLFNCNMWRWSSELAEKFETHPNWTVHFSWDAFWSATDCIINAR